MAARERVIGRGAALADGGEGVRFTVRRGSEDVPAFAVRWRGRVHAFVNACPHQGVELDWLPGAFFDADGSSLVCSLHGARFAPDTGRCIEGPCRGASLAGLAVYERTADGAIVYDAGVANPSDTPERQRRHG
jgi:nitrite reductase/ring-hydroxylating ferredoxin subunit